MYLIRNKHGPDFDVGRLMLKRARDETTRKPRDVPMHLPRDKPVHLPRDKPVQLPCDMLTHMPRDKTILCKDSLVITCLSCFFRRSRDVRIHRFTSSKWRRTRRIKPAAGPVMGELCPVVNEILIIPAFGRQGLRIKNYEKRATNSE